MIPKFQPGDIIRSNNSYIHLIVAVCPDNYYYEVYENGYFKRYLSFQIKSYDYLRRVKLTKLELALL